jgi:NEDD8-activating enzyme E1 regulatory subunit
MQLDPDLLALMHDAKTEVLNSDTPEFWLIVRSVRDFWCKAGALPVTGRLPDMTAMTSEYVNLQRIFCDKAAADIASVLELVEAHAISSGAALSPTYRAKTEHMCKHFRSLRCVRYLPLNERTAVTAANSE